MATAIRSGSNVPKNFLVELSPTGEIDVLNTLPRIQSLARFLVDFTCEKLDHELDEYREGLHLIAGTIEEAVAACATSVGHPKG